IMGKGYLEIEIDRLKAARYGVSVVDIQDTIEMALGGRVVTQTVEGRERFPVRIRYARAQREDEEVIRRLLVSGSSGAPMGGEAGTAMTVTGSEEGQHQAAPEHAAGS